MRHYHVKHSVMLYVKKFSYSSIIMAIIQVSRMFDGKEFCVINGPPGLSKAAIETKIAEVSNCYTHTAHGRYVEVD